MMEVSDAAGKPTMKMEDIFSNRHNRTTKKMFLLNFIKENSDLDLPHIIAKLHEYMTKRTAKDWIEALELNGEIELKQVDGKYIVKVIE